MMRLEVLEEFSSSTDRIIVKRKRTKRPRPSTSSATSSISTSTEEDDDMAANCLILLARGGTAPPHAQEKKFTSRKFTEMTTTTKEGKVGIYVYECKTCNRSFPSFQALGGHRASHKKPKPAPCAAAGERSPPCDQEEVISLPPLSHKSFHLENNKNKIHECSICGSEFGSGQALGGHMRRHRSGVVATNNNTMSYDVSEKERSIFALDLNLPAPPEDERPERSFVFSAAATMVDCHY
ncbi:hypothetical protein RD792_009831 [Penstemon davidsonii]|uniref:C2H2-type domain-containing protein n=1 Tax=Penstemon davidsonii TaxID=160366 RepID=A0ABR0D1H4_9LAMI|nr:hypothetical protein RD792_009831 [Penstemon davidsonii]